MSTTSSLRIALLTAALAAIPVVSVAQTQNQAPQNQNQAQPQPNSTQNQAQPTQAQPNQGQPQQKMNFWQKMKQSAMQGMQNTTQQGTQQVQQGVQGVTNGVQQGAQQAVAGGSSGNASFSGGNSGGSCGPTCSNAGPFLANVSQMTMSQQGGWHVIRMNIQFQNTTNQPLIIAYHDGSMIMTDNNGNTYQGAGGYPGELQGMGVDRGGQTDSQFVLNPGQTSSAMFAVARGRPANSPIGTSYEYDLTIDELQAQNGATAIAVRSFNLNFPALTPGSASSLTSFQSGSTGNAFTGGSGASAGASTASSSTSTMNSGAVSATQTVSSATASKTAPVTNAAIKTPVAAPAKPSPAVKPIPVANATNVKKVTTNSQPTTSTSH